MNENLRSRHYIKGADSGHDAAAISADTSKQATSLFYSIRKMIDFHQKNDNILK